MMGDYQADDLHRLAFEVRSFLDRGDWRRRILGMAKLYLEMPDIGSMFALHRDIMRAIAADPGMMAAVSCGNPVRHIDEETIEIQIGGISIILTCKQRFMTESRKPLGYQSMHFVEIRPLDDD
jgi:hypothetical protein